MHIICTKGRYFESTQKQERADGTTIRQQVQYKLWTPP